MVKTISAETAPTEMDAVKDREASAVMVPQNAPAIRLTMIRSKMAWRGLNGLSGILTSLAENGLDLIRRDDLRVIILILIELHREARSAGLSSCSVEAALLVGFLTARSPCDDVGNLTRAVVNQIRHAVDVDRLGVFEGDIDCLLGQLLLATIVINDGFVSESISHNRKLSSRNGRACFRAS